ncbi:heparinase II/III domain-containing protein [Desulfoluna butyratoxydans]|uniref:heparinase II/III domain-containing protein n=1 Tax=Desulfoluna butyratoxydans TaxID=231438 RepID=UPI0015D137D0|nr:heparinase II/III family protein [Desulfoluna butyratoxydans]
MGDAASLRLETDLSYPQYDKMLFCLSMIPETSIRFEFEVDGKIYKHDEVFWGTGSRLEICIPAPKGHICAIYMIISTKYKFEQMLSLSWFGLQNSSLVKQLQTSIQKYDSSWTGLIKPLDNWEDIHFQVGLLFNETDLEKLREKRLYPGWSDHYRYLEEKATIYMNRHPEADLTAFLPTDDRRYIRESENDRTPYHFEALVLGFVGIINDDKQMMQHALRYLMSMLHTENWVQSAEQKLTGSTWSTRCFMEEMTTTSVVLLADWYAFALTDRAKDLVRQCIWDKGLAIIDRDMMKHDYMHRINQGAWFCRAGILGGLYLENAWPHMGRYVNAKFGTMNKILKRYIMRDGGVDEGIGYFCMTAQAVIPALVAYARSRGKSTHRIINRYFKKADNYLSTLSSFEPGKGSVDGDCRTENFCGDIVPVLAGLFPGSICNDILHQCIQNRSIYNVTGSLINSGGLIGFVYGPDKIKVSKPIVSTFNIMPKSGFAVSARKSGTHSLRILFSGSKPNPSSHAHYDKGAFTVEADGTDVFVDRGMLQYDDPRALLAKCSRMHNVITPYLPNGSYPDQNLPEKRVCPKGSGNEQQVELTLDLAEVWKEYMSSYQRHIISDSVEKIIITDHGTLKKRGRVAFHLHSGVKFDLDAYKAVGTVNSMTFEVTAKWADEILHFEDSLSFDGRALHHLVFHSKELETFSIETTISVKRDSQPTIQMI